MIRETRPIEPDQLDYPEMKCREYYLAEEEVADFVQSPRTKRIYDQMLIKTESAYPPSTNPNHIKRVLNGFSRTEDLIVPGEFIRYNIYEVERMDKSVEQFGDGELEGLHPTDLITLRKTYDESKSNNRFTRIALDSISEAGREVYKRYAQFDFDLCLNMPYAVKNKKNMLDSTFSRS